MGRSTQGLKLINLRNDDSIAAVAKVMKEEDVDQENEIRDLPIVDSEESSVGNAPEEE
jgi:DNA gyrase subunit A